jgi:hypothetical protein
VHSQCRSWVNHDLADQPKNQPLSVVSPRATIRRLSWFVRKVQIAINAPQHISSHIYGTHVPVEKPSTASKAALNRSAGGASVISF